MPRREKNNNKRYLISKLCVSFWPIELEGSSSQVGHEKECRISFVIHNASGQLKQSSKSGIPDRRTEPMKSEANFSRPSSGEGGGKTAKIHLLQCHVVEVWLAVLKCKSRVKEGQKLIDQP